jgi:hypothetical protein
VTICFPKVGRLDISAPYQAAAVLPLVCYKLESRVSVGMGQCWQWVQT